MSSATSPAARLAVVFAISSTFPTMLVKERVNGSTESSPSCIAMDIWATARFSMRTVSDTWLQSRSGDAEFDGAMFFSPCIV